MIPLIEGGEMKRVNRLQVFWKLLVVSSLLINACQGYGKILGWAEKQPLYKKVAWKLQVDGALYNFCKWTDNWGGR